MNGNRMKLSVVVLAFFVVTILGSVTYHRSLAAVSGGPLTYYVSPDGSDRNPGTLELPFHSLAKARDAIRAYKQTQGYPKGGITVYLRKGTYDLAQSFSLTDKDSGLPEAPVVYQSYPGESAVITGSFRFNTKLAKPVSDPAVLKRLPAASGSKVLQLELKQQKIPTVDAITASKGGDASTPAMPQLILNGRALPLARYPNEGFLKTGKVLDTGSVPRSGDTDQRGAVFRYQDERPSSWSSAAGIWMAGYWKEDWYDQTLPIAAIDKAQGTIRTQAPSTYGVAEGQRYYYFNVLEELDAPGEWYLDRGKGMLYLYPPAEEALQDLRLTMVKTPLVSLLQASHITFENLTFESTRGNAFQMKDSVSVRLNRLTLRNIGQQAVVINGGKNSGVSNSVLTELGKGGVYLQGGDRAALTPGGHFAENNSISRYSQVNRTYSSAVKVEGVGNRIAHNRIYDAPHLAIGFSGNDHRIENNEIYDVMKESNDGGAIYSGRDWTSRGTVIRNNYIHDIAGMPGHSMRGAGVYFDDTLGGNQVVGNVFARVDTGIFIHGGSDSTLDSNVMIDSAHPIKVVELNANPAFGDWFDPVNGELYQRLRSIPYQSELWRKRYPELSTLLSDNPKLPKRNVITNNVLVGEQGLELAASASKYGTVKDNVTVKADPGFVDAARHNYQLKDSSLVYRQLPNFKPYAFAEMGPLP